MKKRFIAILLTLAMILSSTSLVLAAPFDLTYSTDNTKNYTFNQFIDSPLIFDFVAANIVGYEIEGLDGTKYNAQEINNRTMTGMTFIEAAASLQATAAVVTAEGSKLQADVDVAQALITALPDGTDKTALQNRLNIVIVVPLAPSVTNDDTLNTVTGMQTGMEYNLDGAGYVAYLQSTFNLINFAGTHTLLVRIAAMGINPPSPATTLVFTGTINENAEAAVTAYETAPIKNAAQIITAEALKAPAEAAVAAVTDSTLKASLLARIAAKDLLITNAKANQIALETTAQANALAAVIAFENQPGSFGKIMDITKKETTDATVLLVNDQTVKEALQLRMTLKVNTLMVDFMNLLTTNDIATFDYYINQYIPYLGLDLTEYNILANKVPVRTAMVDATFVSFTDIQTVFNNAVTAQKTLESGYLIAFNSASDAASIGTAITTYATQLSLTLNQYNGLNLADKTAVQTALLGKNFTSGGDIRTAFLIAMINCSPVNSILTEDNALFLGLGTAGEYQAAYGKTAIEAGITAARPIADKTQLIVVAISSSSNYLYLSWRLPYFKDIMGLDLTDYNGLRTKDVTAVQNELIAATMTTKLEVQNTFNGIVAAKKAAEAPALIAFNNAVSAQDIGTSITTYLVAGELGDYSALANKLPVYETLLMHTYTTLKQVESAIKAASAIQKPLETSALAAINSAKQPGNTSGMNNALLNNASTLGLDLAEYNNFVEQDKLVVLNAMISAPSFTNALQVKTAYDKAIAIQKVIIAINNADAETIGTLITTNATLLGLTLTDYNKLSTIEKSTALTLMVGRAFVDKVAVQTGLNVAVALPTFNRITTAAEMATAITTYSGAVGYVLTDYNLLTAVYKTAVQNSLIPITFSTNADIKAAFEASVAVEKVKWAINYINIATTASQMAGYITTHATTLGLDLTDYNTLIDKVPVQTALIAPTFVTAAEVKTVFDTAVAVAKVNEATIGTIGATLTTNANKLGLNLTDYTGLLSKESVHNAMLSPVFANAAAVKTSFDIAVAARKTIEAPLINTPSVILNISTTSLIAGQTASLTATVLPASAQNKNVTWSSSNDLVATVDSNGFVTSIDGGTAIITVTTVEGGFTDTCLVTVIVPLTGVALNKVKTSVYIGTTDTLTAIFLPANASNKNLIWTVSSGPTLASVNNGVVTGLKIGTATIKVTTVDGSFSATSSVIITNEANVVNAFNNAYTYMASYIIQYANVVGLDLTNYLALDPNSQVQVQDALRNQNFTTTAQIKTTFDAAVLAQINLATLKIALIDAIAVANTTKTTATISADGTNVLPADQWVTSAVMTAYTDAIAATQTVADNAAATQIQLEESVTILATATETFNMAKASGTLV